MTPEDRLRAREYNRMASVIAKEIDMQFCQEETKMKTMTLYRIYAVYSENPEQPLVFKPKGEFFGGRNAEEAILRSGIYLIVAAARKLPTTDPLDPKFVTVIAEPVGDYKVS